jgi:hypothetical protein
LRRFAVSASNCNRATPPIFGRQSGRRKPVKFSDSTAGTRPVLAGQGRAGQFDTIGLPGNGSTSKSCLRPPVLVTSIIKTVAAAIASSRLLRGSQTAATAAANVQIRAGISARLIPEIRLIASCPKGVPLAVMNLLVHNCLADVWLNLKPCDEEASSWIDVVAADRIASLPLVEIT